MAKFTKVSCFIVTGRNTRCLLEITLTYTGQKKKDPVVLLRSLSGKYPWERYDPLILPAMG